VEKLVTKIQVFQFSLLLAAATEAAEAVGLPGS